MFAKRDSLGRRVCPDCGQPFLEDEEPPDDYPGVRVMLTKKQRGLDCAYVGQHGRIVETFADETARVVLKCGHVIIIPLEELETCE